MSRGPRNTPLNLPSRGIARFDGGGKTRASVPSLPPVKFTAGGAYMDQMAAVADLGKGIFNATAKIVVASEKAKLAQKDSYLASVESDDIVQTNRIYNENMLEGNDPKELTTKLEQFKYGKMANMPENIRPLYSRSFDKRAAVATVKSQNAFFDAARKDAESSLEASQEIIKDDIFNSQAPTTEIEAQLYEDKIVKFSSALQSRVDQGFLTLEQASLEYKGFQKELITAGFKSQLKDMPSEERARTILSLQESKSLPPGMGVQDQEDIVNKLSAFDNTLKSVETKAGAAKAASVELETSRVAADLEIKVSRELATYEDVEAAEQDGVITPTKKVQLFKALDANVAKAAKDSESLQKVAQALRGEAFVDPKNTKDKEAVDLTYTQVLLPKIEAEENPAAQKQMITNFVDKMGIVPENLRGKMRGVFRGDDVEQKVYYADLVGRIQDSKPQALDDFDDKDITQAVMIDEMVKAGTPNELAVGKVAKLTEGINAGRLEVLQAELDGARQDVGTKREQNAKVINTVQDAFDEGIFSRNASLPQQQLGVESAAVNDYKKLYETWFLNSNGDATLAKKQAIKALKRTWGTTNVNGTSKQLTKYPIEAAYSGMPAKDIKHELMSDLKKLDQYKDLGSGDVIIQWDERTAREYRDRPSYQVLIFNKEGVLEPVADKNLQRWKPDYTRFQTKRTSAVLKDVTEERAAVETRKAVSRAASLSLSTP